MTEPRLFTRAKIGTALSGCVNNGFRRVDDEIGIARDEIICGALPWLQASNVDAFVSFGLFCVRFEHER